MTRRPGLLGIFIVAITSAVVGCAVGTLAASRTAATAIGVFATAPGGASSFPSPAVVLSPPANPKAKPVQLDEVGGSSSVIEGWASYCAPTPTRCQSWGGSAKLGAVPSFRYGDRPYFVKVCRLSSSACVVVRVVSFCGCGVKVIDLSPAAFKRLTPLWRGVVRVTVERTGGPSATLPPTDTQP